MVYVIIILTIKEYLSQNDVKLDSALLDIALYDGTIKKARVVELVDTSGCDSKVSV